MVHYLLVGIALGAVTGLPIGAVGMTIIDTASRRPLRRALGVALGGGTGDMLWVAIGMLGIGPLLASSPAVRPAMYAVSGAALVVYGSLRLRPQRARSAPRGDGLAPAAPRARERGHARTGFAVGLGLVIANPAGLVTWVAIIGLFLGDAAPAEAVVAVAGVWIGSAGWFAVMACVAHRGTSLLGERISWIPHVAGVMLIGYGLFSFARGARYWIVNVLM